MSHFSGALQVTSLDDFIKPSVACINPVVINRDKVEKKKGY